MFLLQNDLVLLNIPRCASYSTESSIIHSDLNYKYVSTIDKRVVSYSSTNIDDFYKNTIHLPHGHFRLNDCYSLFGRKQAISITRDYFDKFLSSLSFFYELINYQNDILDVNIVDIQFIKKRFNLNFVYLIENEPNELKTLLINLFGIDDTNLNIKLSKALLIFNSIKWWQSNEIIKYEFDINEMDKFKYFIENRYGTSITIPHENKSNKNTIFPNLIINDILKSYIWETFEKKYHTKTIF
jgi:hypothetical protein